MAARLMGLLAKAADSEGWQHPADDGVYMVPALTGLRRIGHRLHAVPFMA